MHPTNVRHRALAVLALLCVLAACGGGGGGSASPLPTTPQSTPSSSVPAPYTLNTIADVSPTGVAVRRRAADTQTALIYFILAPSAGGAFVTEFKASLVLSSTSGTVSLSQWENGAWVGTNATVTVNGTAVSFDYSINPPGSSTVLCTVHGTRAPVALAFANNVADGNVYVNAYADSNVYTNADGYGNPDAVRKFRRHGMPADAGSHDDARHFKRRLVVLYDDRSQRTHDLPQRLGPVKRDRHRARSRCTQWRERHGHHAVQRELE